MYAIKIMSNANMADSDVGKGFKMIMVEAGDTFEFGHDPDTGKPQVTVTGFRAGDPTIVTYPVTGNCYVLSETGKTIASFWGRSLGVITQPEVAEENRPSNIGVIRGMPFSDNCTVMRKQWEDRGLTNIQVMLLQEPRLALKARRIDRDKAYRARVGYLMSHGIPRDIAMTEALYLLGDKETGIPEV